MNQLRHFDHIQNKNKTDRCCLFIGLFLFSFPFLYALYILALSNQNSSTSSHSNTLLPISLHYCGSGYLYLPNLNDPNDSSCIQKCEKNFTPKHGICYPNDDKIQNIYQQNKAIKQVLQKATLSIGIVATFGMSLLLGITWLIYFILCSKGLSTELFILGASSSMTVLGLILLYYLALFPGKIIGSFCLFIGFCLFTSLYTHQNQFKLVNAFLTSAKGKIFQNQSFFHNLRLLIFVSSIFLTKTLLQMLISIATQNYFLYIVSTFTAFWTSKFLENTLSFLTANNVLDQYSKYEKKSEYSTWNRFNQHLGSIIGGSLVNCIFQSPLGLMQILEEILRGFFGLERGVYENRFQFLQLLKSDTYTFISLMGSNFWSSSSKISEITLQFRKSSKLRGIKIHKILIKLFFFTTFVCILILTFQNQTIKPSLLSYLVLFFVFKFTFSPFIYIWTTMAETLQVFFLVQNKLASNKQIRPFLLKGFKKDMIQLEHMISEDK